MPRRSGCLCTACDVSCAASVGSNSVAPEPASTSGIDTLFDAATAHPPVCASTIWPCANSYKRLADSCMGVVSWGPHKTCRLAVVIPVMWWLQGHFVLATPVRYGLPVIPLVGAALISTKKPALIAGVGVVLPVLCLIAQHYSGQL